jgi:hypothetical protein
MASVTLTIDEDLLRRARIRALQQGTSVNGLVREWLERYAGEDRQRTATEQIIAIAERSQASSGDRGRTWTRDDVYQERLDRNGR